MGCCWRTPSNAQHAHSNPTLCARCALCSHAQSKHSLLLEVLGERNERVEQLEEDVRDMKRIFHEQLQVSLIQRANKLLGRSGHCNE